MKIMKDNYPAAIKSSILIVIGYLLSFILSFQGYGATFVLVFFVSTGVILYIAIESFRGLSRLLYAFFIVCFCFLLNCVYAKFSGLKPKSEIGFAVFWSIIQSVMVFSLLVMALLTEHLKRNYRK